MNIKSKILYTLMRMGKENFRKVAAAYIPAEHTLEKDIGRAQILRDGSKSFDQIISLMSSAPEGIKNVNTMKGGVHTVIIHPEEPSEHAILYLHGGAWVIGLTNIHKMFAAQLAKATQSPVWAVDYRLAPEHPFPAGLDDCFAVYKTMLDEGLDPRKITLIGESAGGNLILSLLLKLKQEGLPLPGASVPMSPFTDLNMSGKTHITHDELDPVIPNDPGKSIQYTYLRNESPNNPLVSPLLGDLNGLPPILILVGGQEILLDDSVSFAEKARMAGVDVTLDIHQELFHTYPLFYDIIDDAKVALGKIALFIKMKTAS